MNKTEGQSAPDTSQSESGYMTVAGQPLNILNPEHAPRLSINLLAVSLARTPRFGGHTRDDLPAYNVAQHSVGVRILLRERGESDLVQMLGLIHDLSEAILVDIPKPLKMSPVFQMYRELEDRWQNCLYKDFAGTTPSLEEKAAIKWADEAILRFEVRNFMKQDTEELKSFWEFSNDCKNAWVVDRVLEHFMPLGEHSSRALFLRHFEELAQKI